MANTLNVHLQSLGGDLTFAARSGTGHWTMIDGSKKAGGNDGAASLLELLLEALAGCTGMDTLSILKKKRTPFRKLEIFVEGDKREEHPRIITDIRLRFVLHTGGGEKALRDLKRAAELSYEKYCTVSNMLKESADISYETEIVDAE